MKKVLTLLLVFVLCVMFCSCDKNTSDENKKSDNSNKIEENKEVLEAETIAPTKTPTEPIFEIETTDKTENSTEPKTELTLPDVTGDWQHTQWGINDTINITRQDGNTLYMKICSVRGNGMQFAETDVIVTISSDAAGSANAPDTLNNISGKGTFSYVDSFGNKGTGEIFVSSDSITLSIYQSYDSGSGWGIISASGDYVKS